jgi:hypothetical protein
VSDTNTPSWLQDATLKPAQPKRAVKQEQPPDLRSDAERISAARAASIQWCKKSNSFGDGFGYDESHYQDFAGSETSCWDAMHLVYIARILETPILKCSKFVWDYQHYDPRKGAFTLSDAPAVTIAELKAAIDARIGELGLSKPLIWEWLSVPHPDDDFGRAIWREDFTTRISRFRVEAA